MTMCAPSFHVVTCGRHQSMSYTSTELQTSNTISHMQWMYFKHQFIQSCIKCTSNIKYNQSHCIPIKCTLNIKYKLNMCRHTEEDSDTASTYTSYSLTVRQHACCKSLNAVKNRIYNYDKCDNWHLYASVKKKRKNTYILTLWQAWKASAWMWKTERKEK